MGCCKQNPRQFSTFQLYSESGTASNKHYGKLWCRFACPHDYSVIVGTLSSIPSSPQVKLSCLRYLVVISPWHGSTLKTVPDLVLNYLIASRHPGKLVASSGTMSCGTSVNSVLWTSENQTLGNHWSRDHICTNQQQSLFCCTGRTGVRGEST